MKHTFNMNRVLSVLIALALILAIMLPATVAGAVEIIDGDGAQLNLEVSKGKLVRLDRAAHTVFVADPDIADIQVKSPRLIYLLARKPGETTLFAVDEQERVLANIPVIVSHNLGGLRRAASELVPGANIAVSSVEGAIVIEGDVENATQARDIANLAEKFLPEGGSVLNRLRVTAPNQINLRVRVAEITRGVDKQLGFNWTAAGSLGGLTLGLATANPFSGAALNSVTGSTTQGGWNLNSVIDALEEEGLVQILAEPNLTATSGETASFLAGGEFPILVPGSDGSVTIDFKKFGVSLAFTPTLVGSRRINLHVRPEVSQLSTTNAVTLANFQVPALTTRRAETTVELGSGQSFAIAGLLQNNVTHDISKFPGLGDVPVLGNLFKSDRFQRDESELVIIVTPYLVKPVSQRLAAPTDKYLSPHDAQRYGYGGTNRQLPAEAPTDTMPDTTTDIPLQTPARNPSDAPTPPAMPRTPVSRQPVQQSQDGTTLIGPAGFRL